MFKVISSVDTTRDGWKPYIFQMVGLSSGVGKPSAGVRTDRPSAFRSGCPGAQTSARNYNAGASAAAPARPPVALHVLPMPERQLMADA